jgi:hypothetical protein
VAINNNQPNPECLDCAHSRQREIWRCSFTARLKHWIEMPCPTTGDHCGDYEPTSLAGMVEKAKRA